jgi:hypothetical protein
MLTGASPTTTIALLSTTITTLPAVNPGNNRADPLIWTVLPILISLGALVVALLSARSAAQSLGLNVQRRREEQAPSIEYVGANKAPDEGIRIVNPAAVAYESVRFTIVPSQDEPDPVEALQVGYHEPELGFQQQWIKAGEPWDLGPLGAGEAQVLDLHRPRLNEPGGPSWPTTGGTLRMLIDCKTSTYTVLVIRLFAMKRGHRAAEGM